MGDIFGHFRTVESNKHFDFIEIVEGVFACIHRPGGSAICNVGVVNLGEETLIFDAFMSPDVAKVLVDYCSQYNLPPIKYVINSHWHSDHIRGNQVFSDEVEIISTRETLRLMEENIPVELNNRDEVLRHWSSLKNDVENYAGSRDDRSYQEKIMWLPFFEEMADTDSRFELRYPNSVINETRVISGSFHEVHLVPTGPAHTANDLIAYIPGQNILFASDLVHAGMHPYFSDGDIRGLKNQLREMIEIAPACCLPGHGPISDVNAIAEMVNYVEAVEKVAQNLKGKILKNKSADIEIPDAYRDWWFPQFFEKNVHFMLAKI